MGRTVRQKRKNRSSRPVVRTDNRRKKQLNPTGNTIVAKNWNKQETLTQNYRRLGLVNRLQKPAGGVDPRPHSQTSSGRQKPRDPFAIGNAAVVGDVRVERDADGKIIRLLDDGRRANPLGDALAEFDSDSEGDEQGADKHRTHEVECGGISENEDDESRPAVIRALEREARRGVIKTKRHQSDREREWLERLVEKHGHDTDAMAQDRRLNPMQQTAADISRRIRKMIESS